MPNISTSAPNDSGTAATALVLQGVYLKDCSFEAPQGPRANGEWNPQISLDLNTNAQLLGGDLREVVLTVTVSAKQGEQTLFLVEVKQAGAFVMQNLSAEELKRAVGSVCPGVTAAATGQLRRAVCEFAARSSERDQELSPT
jgi:preprotein translocase subunit SecB